MSDTESISDPIIKLFWIQGPVDKQIIAGLQDVMLKIKILKMSRELKIHVTPPYFKGISLLMSISLYLES